MGRFEYLADGHHVDDAGNLIACTYVDFRDPAERSPIAVLQKASSKQRAIPGCATIRLSISACFLERGVGVASAGESHQRCERLALLRVHRVGDGRGAGGPARGRSIPYPVTVRRTGKARAAAASRRARRAT